MALGALGDVTGARENFAIATKLEGEQLTFLAGVREAEFMVSCGQRKQALEQMRYCRRLCGRYRWSLHLAFCDTLYGLLLLPSKLKLASQYLESAIDFGHRSGDIEIQLRCHLLAAELSRHLDDYRSASFHCESGILLADGCGFGKYSIDLRLELVRLHLCVKDEQPALQRAQEALERSTLAECQYAWGEADALHLLGVAHARLGELEAARRRLEDALTVREWLTHPGLDETRAALTALP
jgi:tetratricopeptide (TPR) repeat protein